MTNTEVIMNATTYEITVQNDHLERFARTRKPVLALAELLWNAVDADAEHVSVTIGVNELGGLNYIKVSDDGHGLPHSDASVRFSRLGGSSKRAGKRSKNKNRLLHGQEGQGRFLAFALASSVKWQVTYRDADGLMQYNMTMSKDALHKVTIEDPAPASKDHDTGVTVMLTDLEKRSSSLLEANTSQELAEIFALYLRQHRDVSITLGDTPINPKDSIDRVSDYSLKTIHVDGKNFETSLEIVEWKMRTERSLFLCNSDGFPLDSKPADVRAQGIHYTAYLKSDYFGRLMTENKLEIADMDAPTKEAMDDAKGVMRDHFRNSAAMEASELVAQWQQEHIYPYDGDPKSEMEDAERKVFNVLALNVNEYLPSFQKADPKTKRFNLTLLRHSLEHAPSDLSKIVTEVLELPQQKRKELASLLDRTTLAHLINASRIVADRLEFLEGLSSLVFDSTVKSHVRERSQLHKILAKNAWIFNEQYHLSVNDRSLTQVLRKHADIKGLDVTIDLETPVLRDDGSKGIIDLMFSRNTQLNGSSQREHLIVELKRPTVPITMRTMSQIHSYARAVARDERFNRIPANWVFWAVSSEIDDQVRDLITGDDKQPGIFHKGSNPKMTIWAKTWSEIINDCKVRLEFFAERLEYTPDEDASIKHLRDVYGEYLDNVPLRKAQARG